MPDTGLNATQLNTFLEEHSKLVLRMTKELPGSYGSAKFVRGFNFLLQFESKAFCVHYFYNMATDFGIVQEDAGKEC